MIFVCSCCFRKLHFEQRKRRQHKQEDAEHMKLDPNANVAPTTLREEDDE